MNRSNETESATYLTIMGVPKAGKTTVAATVSEQCPEELPAKKMVDIEDTAWLLYDKDGLEALTDVNLSVPYVDLSGVQSSSELIKAEKAFFKEVSADPKIKWVVVDTVSERDRLMISCLADELQQNIKMWGYVAQEHAMFLRELRKSKKSAVFLFHTKLLSSPLDEVSDVAKKKATTANAEVVLAISGQNGRGYRTTSTAIWTIQKKKRKGQPAEHLLLTEGSSMNEGGSRFANRLAETEKAHLRNILKKVGKV